MSDTETLANWWQQLAPTPCLHSQAQAQARQNQLTKPSGSLGRLEEIAIHLAALQGKVIPTITQPQMVVFAGDHGVVAQGVSAFPQAVTLSMLTNFVQGGAAVSVLCRLNEIGLRVVNCGTATSCTEIAQVIHRPVMLGTYDFHHRAAMQPEQAQQALLIGKEQLDDLQQAGCDFFMAGEMGIGNTSAASCMAALLLQQDVEQLTGPGTGLQGSALSHKVQVLKRSVARAKPFIANDLNVLEQVGGLEIAAMTGAYVRAAQLGIASLVDGFISTCAALLAVKLNPSVRPWLLFAHHSAEPGHTQLLDALAARPLLQFGLRLGEGSGAASAFVLVREALAIHHHMATFGEAGVETA